MINRKPVRRAVYVEVNADMSAEGFMRPRSILWPDGRVFPIDRVCDWLPAKAPEQARPRDIYTVQIRGHLRYLYFEQPKEYFRGQVGRWYVEVTDPAQ